MKREGLVQVKAESAHDRGDFPRVLDLEDELSRLPFPCRCIKTEAESLFKKPGQQRGKLGALRYDLNCVTAEAVAKK